MKLKSHHWMLSALLALSTHSALLIALLMTYETHGAKAEGENGIEINLGMLGDAGVAMVSTSAVKLPATVKETLDAQVEKTTIKQPKTPVANQATKVKKVKSIQTKQTPEIHLKEPEKTATEDVKPAIVLIDDITPPQDFSDESDVTTLIHEADSHETKSDKFKTDTETPNQESQLAKTTGNASDINAGGQAGYHQDYLAKLVAQLTEHKHYPRLSRKRSEEGIAVLRFDISRTGRVLHYQIEKSSGFSALDKAVLAMLKNAEPFAPVPSEIEGEQISFTLPIAFKMKSS